MKTWCHPILATRLFRRRRELQVNYHLIFAEFAEELARRLRPPRAEHGSRPDVRQTVHPHPAANGARIRSLPLM